MTQKKTSIVFATNFINHHQAPVADQLYARDDVEYHLVQTAPMTAACIQNGYPDYSDRPYLINAYQSELLAQEAQKLIDTADVVILGASDWRILGKRLRQNKLTFFYSERWFREGFFKRPRLPLFYIKWHFLNNFRKAYMLCSGAFVSKDCHKVGSYINKCFKWGYFVDVPQIDIKQVLESKSKSDRIKMLFVARFMVLKHPELPVKLARILKDRGYDFEINMYGTGECENDTKELIDCVDVADCVNLRGNVPNSEILEQMRQHHIYLFTSDRNEGWGAVLGEAMSNGCVPVTSDKIGATPYLVENGHNGLIFKDRNLENLVNQVIYLIDNPSERERMAYAAYKTMKDIWSPENATNSLMDLIRSIQSGKIKPADYGPCSKA